MKARPHRRPSPDVTPGNYLAVLLAAAAKHAVPGEVTELVTMHDDWCAFLAGRGPCDCSPTVKTMADHRLDHPRASDPVDRRLRSASGGRDARD
jgi:hypothetical protein